MKNTTRSKQHSVFSLMMSLGIIFALTSTAQAQSNSPLGMSNKKTQARIETIIDSATVRLVDGRKMRMIGLIPLDRPQTKDLPRNEYNIIIEKEDPIIPFEQTAYDTIKDMLNDKDILLEFDNLYRDREGFILAYIFLPDGTLVNAEILRQGFSNLSITPPNTKYENEMRAAYLEAKKEKRGLQGN